LATRSCCSMANVYPSPPMKLLITGSQGMLGTDVCTVARRRGHEIVGFPHSRLDITDAGAVQDAVRAARPDVVVNCAAWTDVDGAETSPEEALVVNGAGAGHVAGAAFQSGAWTIHVSSDYVFDGAKRDPYVESDPVAPKSGYGRSKLAGELAVAAEAPERHTTVRSSWLFGASGHCFPATIRRLAAERDELTVVDDQVGCPTFTGHLAEALVDLADRRVSGVLHVAADGGCSWYEFAREIVASSGLACEVKPGSTSDLARPAPRPAYSVLGTEREPEAPRLPGWRAGLADYLAALGAPVR
jgi:dTDP-4-dehydrorhamnose reductase